MRENAAESRSRAKVFLETSNVVRFNNVIENLADTQKGEPAMAVVAAHSGEGKTTAISMFMRRQQPNSLTGLPDVIAIAVDNKSTARNLAIQIMRALDERPRGRNANEITHEVAAAIVRNNVWLLIVDEADALSEDGLEVLRHLHDRTGCCVLLVGIPSVRTLIQRHEKFESRIANNISFLPIEIKEVIENILPGLKFEHWRFDPTNPQDREMAVYLWNTVKPSLRRLYHWLQIAEGIASSMEEFTYIDMDILKMALQFQVPPPEETKRDKGARKAKPNSPEEESERRHAAKTKK